MAPTCPGKSMRKIDEEDFVTLYPGVCTEREAAPVERFLADNEALAQRGPIDATALAAGALPDGTPGVGPSLPVTEAMVRYNNAKYDPENPLLNDAEYARRAGFRDILAFPTFGAHDDTFMVPYPFDARDTLLVSQLGHSVTSYEPIHPGDTLFLVADRRHVKDRTPAEGSVYRTVRIETEGSVYNQNGKKVNDVVFGVTESVKIYREGRRPANMGFRDSWEAPDWTSRPAHCYTDEDWEFITDVWRKETRRGPIPRYWEDVRVGDRPMWTSDGPIDRSVLPTDPYGMGTDGSRTLKREILDPTIFATMVRGSDGIYRLPDRNGHIPDVPDGAESPMAKDVRAGEIDTTDIHRQTGNRAILINFLGRDIAIRHLNNWMGDHGRLHNIRWGIMPATCLAAYGKPVPEEPAAAAFLDVVPELAGKKVSVHGLTGDLALVKSYVYDKYVQDGSFVVELAWWIETIERDIWLAGGATVRLPSRKLADAAPRTG
jgi:acyl dehydratase